MRFTDAKLKAITKPAKRTVIWEGDSGFGVRVEITGRKIFVQSYRYGGKFHIVTLGKYPAISLAQANTEAAKIREKLSKGIDPKQTIEAARKADKEAFTVSDLVGEYVEKYAKPKKKSWAVDQRILNKELLPSLGRTKAKDIKRRDIVLLLDKIVDRGAPIIANRSLAVIRKMFNFALSRSILESSPCYAIQAPSKENRRDRILSEEEIKTFWERLETARMTRLIKLALQLQLVTGQRKGEIVGAAWPDIDLKGGWWTIPKEKAKNGLSHRVPLSPLALDLLKQVKELSGGSRWCFPSPLKDRHITEPAIDRAVRNNKDIFGFHFVPHDLRRTAASLMTGAKVPRLVVSKILNHAEGGVTAVYDRHGYDDEKRQALETWARKLESIISGEPAGKIVELRAGRERMAK